jgi:hypothetical protein
MLPSQKVAASHASAIRTLTLLTSAAALRCGHWSLCAVDGIKTGLKIFVLPRVFSGKPLWIFRTLSSQSEEAPPADPRRASKASGRWNTLTDPDMFFQGGASNAGTGLAYIRIV